MKNPAVGLSKTNSNKRRSESESPYRDKLGKSQGDNSLQKSDRRYTSTTPRQEKNERANNNKPDTSSFANRFGPLEKIKEIITTAKKPNPSPNVQANNTKTNNTQQQKPFQGRVINVPLDPIAKTLLNQKNSYSSSFNPISSIIQNGRNGQVEFSTVLQNAMSPVKNNPNNVQQTKVIKPYTNTLNASAVQQKPMSNSNILLPLLTNPPQQNLAQSQNISSIISQASTLNTRPAFPIFRIEDQPKKKIVYIPPPQSNKMKVSLE